MSRFPSVQQVRRLYKDLLRYGQNLQYTDKDYFYNRIYNEFKKSKKLDSDQAQFSYERFIVVTKENGCIMMLLNIKMVSNLTFSYHIYSMLRTKSSIDYTKRPVLIESELVEKFVRGSGPGGQSVNKTANCVVLKHLPTGITVKCHDSRSQDDNRKTARELLINKLDFVTNGDMSIEAQKTKIAEKKSLDRKRKREKLAAMKAEWRKRESDDSNEKT